MDHPVRRAVSRGGTGRHATLIRIPDIRAAFRPWQVRWAITRGRRSRPLRNRTQEIIGSLVPVQRRGDGRLPRELVSFIESTVRHRGHRDREPGRMLEAQERRSNRSSAWSPARSTPESPYTGGHCQRVPEPATMLAAAACEAKEGPVPRFRDGLTTSGKRCASLPGCTTAAR